MKILKKVKNLWSKARLYVVLAAILIILLSIIHYQRGQIQSWKGRHSDVLEIAKRDSTVATYYINAYGQEVAKSKMLTLTARDAVKLAETQNLQFLKQIEGLKRNYSNLEQAIHVQAKLVFEKTLPLGTLQTLPSPAWTTSENIIFNPDTSIFINSPAIERTFQYKDQYNFIQGRIVNDSVSIKGSSEVPISGAIYWKRKKFLGIGIGKKVYESAFFTPNPFAKITGTETIKIIKR